MDKSCKYFLGVAAPGDGRPELHIAIYRPFGLAPAVLRSIFTLYYSDILNLFLCLISFSLFPCARV